jgi:hypothetical protein
MTQAAEAPSTGERPIVQITKGLREELEAAGWWPPEKVDKQRAYLRSWKVPETVIEAEIEPKEAEAQRMRAIEAGEYMPKPKIDRLTSTLLEGLKRARLPKGSAVDLTSAAVELVQRLEQARRRVLRQRGVLRRQEAKILELTGRLTIAREYRDKIEAEVEQLKARLELVRAGK